MDNKTFTYQYSASENREVESIRRKYLPKEETKLERLKRLDGCVDRAGVIESLVLGIIGCLVFGVGMCFGLRVFSGGWLPAILLCALGAVIMLPAYPVYRKIKYKKTSELSFEILQLSDELIGLGTIQNVNN